MFQHHRSWFAQALALSILLAPACAKKKMSDRDTRREQARYLAATKRQELQPAAGLYRGAMRQGSFSQDVTLMLEIKDIPDTASGEVDPILTPTLTGSLRLTYGNVETGEFYAYGVTKADFDRSRQAIDLVVNNQQFKEVVIALSRHEDELKGSWNAPSSAAAGELTLRKVEPLNLQASNQEIRGSYAGVLTWDGKDVYQQAALTITTVQNKADSFAISGNIALAYGDAPIDSQPHLLDQIEFNPITRQISLSGANSEEYFTGQLEFGKITGNWFSKTYGKIGTASFQKAGKPSIPAGAESVKPLSGEYLGYASWDALKAYQKTSLNLVVTYDNQGLPKLSATGRFWFGDVNEGEQLVYQLTNTELNPTTGYAVLKTQDASVTLKGYIRNNRFEGEWFTAIRGYMGPMLASKLAGIVPPATLSPINSLKGTYQGQLRNVSDQTNLPERFKIGLVTTPDLASPNGIRVTGHVRFYLGPFDSQEYEEKPCEFIQFDFHTRQLVCKLPPDIGLSVKGDVGPNGIKGELFHDALNRVAVFELQHVINDPE